MIEPEPLDPFEAELSKLSPIPPSISLDAAIATQLTAQTPASSVAPNSETNHYSFADRMLLSTLSAGLIAACVIITIFALDFTASRSQSHEEPTLARIPYLPPSDDPQQLLAQLMADPSPTYSNLPVMRRSSTLPN